ncbi:phosphatidylcholine and lysophosphatidylcholine phospholipase [Allomyces javanicus]|nr:phosphatidylcholine and lysophosphatidylcholine phospholipase [Allomyces javanicus]
MSGLVHTLAAHVSAIVGGLASLFLIRVPAELLSLLTRVLSWSLVLTFDYRGVVAVLSLGGAVTYGIVYRVYLTRYARLPDPPLQAAGPPPGASFDLHPDAATAGEFDDSTKSGSGSGGSSSSARPALNYAEEFLGSFLQSIKVFGYMEQPVFHELARRLQTRKLPAGDILFAEDDALHAHEPPNFYIVVEGAVHVLVKNPVDANPVDAAPPPSLNASFYHGQGPVPPSTYSAVGGATAAAAAALDPTEPLPGYTLLHEVHAGGTVSSLFSILSLFSSTLEPEGDPTPVPPPMPPPPMPPMPNDEYPEFVPNGTHGRATPPPPPGMAPTPSYPGFSTENSSDGSHGSGPVFPLLGGTNTSPVSTWRGVPRGWETASTSTGAAATIGLGYDDNASVYGERAGRSRTASASRFGTAPPRFPSRAPSVAVPPSRDEYGRPHTARTHTHHHRAPSVLHAGLVARAARDSTLVVIPAEAFLRLLDKYPHAAAHIAQVILTRFQRVTCMALARYLGLGAQLLALEQQVHEYAARALPLGFFRPGGLERLRRRFRMGHSVYRAVRAVSGNKVLTVADARDAAALAAAVVAPETAPSSSPTIPPALSRTPSGVNPAVAEAATAAAARIPRPSSAMGSHPAVAPSDPATMPGAGPSLAPAVSAEGPFGDLRAFEDADEEDHLRQSVFACIMHAIGLRDVSVPAAATPAPPVDSPSVPLMMRRRSGAAANVAHTLAHHASMSSMSSSIASNVSEVDPKDVEIRFYPKGSILAKSGQAVDGLFFIIDGLLAVSTAGAVASSMVAAQTTAATAASAAGGGPQFFIRPGGLGNYMSVLTGHPSFLQLEARTDVCVGFLKKAAVDRLVDRQPTVILTLAHRLVSVLNPLVLHIDFAMEWTQVNAGHVLYRQGDSSDSIYLLLNGRVRSIWEHGTVGGAFDVIAEYGQGDSVGELEVLMESPRPYTTHAIRDTELARIPHTLFHALALRHPEITLAIARLIAARAQQLAPLAPAPRLGVGLGMGVGMGAMSANNANLRTVAVIPVNASVPIVEFAEHLRGALATIGASATALYQATVIDVLGKHAFSKIGKLKLVSWLAEQEDRHRIVMYVADSGVSTPWTQRCVRQADCILLVALADQEPVIGEYERYLLGIKTTARKELVLVHSDRSCRHGLTQAWLKNRLWIHGHHHVAMDLHPSTALFSGSGGKSTGKPPRGTSSGPARARDDHSATRGRHGSTSVYAAAPMNSLFSSSNMADDLVDLMGPTMGVDPRFALHQLKGQLQKYYQRYTPLLRRMRILGGGEGSGEPGGCTGVRSDFARLARRLCGQSIGLVLGGGGARGIAHVGVIRALEEAGIPVDMIGGTSIGALVGGLYARDFDHVSVLGRMKSFAARTSSVWRTLVDLTYPITSYLTGHQFNRGIWKSFGDIHVEDLWLNYFCVTTNIVHSRMEIHQSGYLWRYVRASMSLSGFMPPLSDNGNLLVDGGYLNNLPADVMKGLGAKVVIMVDVASDDDTSKVYFGDTLSGWTVLLNRMNPFRRTPAIPSLAEIQSKLAYVSCIRQLEEAKQLPGCFYLRPPVAHFGTLEFGNFEPIYRAGYEYGMAVVQEWEKNGVLETLTNTKARRSAAAPRARRNSI